MQVTDVRIKWMNQGEGKVRALCSIEFDCMFALHELRVVDGAKGLFVSMPRRKINESEYRDLAHPITGEAREMIQKRVLQAYHQIKGLPQAAENVQVEENDMAEGNSPVDGNYLALEKETGAA